MLDELLTDSVASGASEEAIEVTGMFFGNAPGMALSPDRVAELARRGASLSITLRTTDYGPIARGSQSDEPTTVAVSFLVKGLFEPSEFTERVGLQPTSSIRRQEPRKLMARVSTWRIKIGPIVADVFPDSATNELLRVVAPSARRIRETVAASGTGSAVRFAGIYGHSVPKLVIRPEQFAAIAALGCAIEFSLMVERQTGDLLEF